MSLRLFNTLARAIVPFKPLKPAQVSMYVCGMTVYDFCHLGHARAMLSFDVVQRWFKASGYTVNYVRNVTDIDDKIIQRAIANGETIGQLTNRMIDALHVDADALGIERPTHEPRATQYVGQMLSLIQKLEVKGFAYPTHNDGDQNQDVNFSVRKFPNYGKLSGKSLDDLRAGDRVAVAGAKQDPLDFVLWKAAKPSEPDEAKWDSPYGLGRPGWHIECSAMSCALLGEHFDIHGGGADLQFPHHENEIAQSEAALNAVSGQPAQPMANYWMHNGFVNVDNEKMSKSLGNFFTIRDVLKIYNPEVVRFFIIRTHYRSPLNYSDVHLDDAKAALKRLYTALDGAAVVDATPISTSIDWLAEDGYAKRFKAAMDEDFGTPEAVAVLFELASDVNRTQSSKLACLLRGLGGILGLLQQTPRVFLQAGLGADHAAIQAQIGLRAEAKKNKDFAQADRIRHTLMQQGIVLKDSPTGTTWEAAT